MSEQTANAKQPEQLDANAKPIESETNGTQSDTGGQGERLFTQDEVNRIVKERLLRDRSKASQEQQDKSAARAAELDARENRLTCREYLLEKGLPAELLDTIDTSNPEDFKRKAENTAAAFSAKKPRTVHKFVQHENYDAADVIAEAFKNDRHTPRGK